MSNYHYREFEKIMSLGSVNAASEILALQRIMRDCISEISGLAQPPHSTSEEEARRDEEEYKLGWERVRNMVKDIAMALTGEEIKFPCDIKQDKINGAFENVMNDGDYKCDDTNDCDCGHNCDGADDLYKSCSCNPCKCDNNGTILDALDVLGDRITDAFDNKTFNERWLRAKKVVRGVLKDE